jgi:hypothetical protein
MSQLVIENTGACLIGLPYKDGKGETYRLAPDEKVELSFDLKDSVQKNAFINNMIKKGNLKVIIKEDEAPVVEKKSKKRAE